MAKTKKAPVAKATTAPPRADINGWILCPGDGVLIVSPGEEYHGLFGKVDAFPTILELSSYVQIDGRPSTVGRVLVPNAHLRWMGPGLEQVDQLRPTRPGQRVRVVLDNESLATPEMKALDGQLGEVTELGPLYGDNLSMITIKFDNPALLPAAINSFDLIIVPTPVVQYVPEPEVVAEHPAIEGESDLPMVEDAARLADGREGRPTPHHYLTELAPTLTHAERSIVASVGYAGKDMAKFFGSGHITAIGLYRKGALVLASTTGGPANRYIVATGLPEILASLTKSPTPTPAPKASPVTLSMVGEMTEAYKVGLRLVPLASIVVTTNTRKVFDETALAELAESVKAHGILQPIVLRPYAADGIPGSATYELVAGGRRYQAATLAGLTEVPATVRNLTDREFIEVQLLENLQRVDVRPADEAQAFSKLLKNDFSAEEVALKVGKPVKFVLQRAKLTSLIPFWFEALEQERLLLVSANELARLPAHSQLLVKQSYREDDYPHGWPAVEIRSKIESKVTRNLEKAPWDKADATLVPSAGACTTCPKRSSCQALLFEQDAPALCLDGACFASKEIAFVARRRAELTQEMGEAPKQVSSNWSLTPEQKQAGVISYEHFSWVEANHTQAVPVLVMDGEHAGQIKHVNLYSSSRGKTGTKEENKAQRDAAILANRIGRAKNDMWAGMLRDLLRNQIAGNGIGARMLVDSFLRDLLTWGRSRTTNDTLDYLHEQYGWTKATEKDKEAYSTGTAPSSHRQYLNREMGRMPLLDKLVLYFDLKFIREGLDNAEISNRQNALVKLLPTDYQDEFNITAKVEKLVQERYYTRKGKKQEATA